MAVAMSKDTIFQIRFYFTHSKLGGMRFTGECVFRIAAQAIAHRGIGADTTSQKV